MSDMLLKAPPSPIHQTMLVHHLQTVCPHGDQRSQHGHCRVVYGAPTSRGFDEVSTGFSLVPRQQFGTTHLYGGISIFMAAFGIARDI